MNHNTVFSQIDRVDRTFLVINVFFLMFVAFIPFPTTLLAEHLKDDGARAATITYGLTLTLVAISYSVLWFYASVGRRLLRADADPRTVAGITRSYLPGPWIYGAATLIAVASPSTSVVLVAAFALFYVVESSVFGRDRAVTNARPTSGAAALATGGHRESHRGDLR